MQLRFPKSESIAEALRDLADQIDCMVDQPEVCTVVVCGMDLPVVVSICGTDATTDDGIASLAKGQHVLLNQVMPFGTDGGINQQG